MENTTDKTVDEETCTDGNNTYKKYISYFQRVQTIGVLSCGIDHEEAADEAKRIMAFDDTKSCYYDETDFDLSDTVEYDPDVEVVAIDPHVDGKSLVYTIQSNNKFLQDVSRVTGTKVEDIDEEALSKFFIDSINMFVEKGEKKFNM